MKNKKVKLLLIIFLLYAVSVYSQSSISGESDTTLIATQSWYGKTITIRYYFKRENYNKAYKYIFMANIPYNALNPQAQQEMEELLKYIIKAEEVILKPKKK